jgi:hypothetical protein
VSAAFRPAGANAKIAKPRTPAPMALRKVAFISSPPNLN